MPSMARSMLARATPKPACWTASASARGSAGPLTRACSVARFTAASATPGTRRSARSTRPAQEAQVMPVIAMSRAGSAAMSFICLRWAP